MKSLNDIRLITLASQQDVNGMLVPIEGGADIPFDVRRVFYVRAGASTQRGCHVHRKCCQFLTCLHGSCDVICDDGQDRKTFRLERLDQGLLIPPTIWAKQNYLQEQTVLMVLCDQPYDAGDYIRDYESFLRWRNVAGQ